MSEYDLIMNKIALQQQELEKSIEAYFNDLGDDAETLDDLHPEDE